MWGDQKRETYRDFVKGRCDLTERDKSNKLYGKKKQDTNV